MDEGRRRLLKALPSVLLAPVVGAKPAMEIREHNKGTHGGHQCDQWSALREYFAKNQHARYSYSLDSAK